MTHVTVPDLPIRETYISTGQTSFPFSFSWFEDADVLVYADNVIQANPGDYTLTGNVKDEGFEGGTCVFGATVAVGVIISIVRSVKVDRLTDFPTAGPFNITKLNTELDRIIAMMQERKANEGDNDLSRTIRLNDSDPDANLTLCLLSERRGKYLAFDTNGDVICLEGTTSDPNAVSQNGTVVPGNMTRWTSSQLIEDAGVALTDLATQADLTVIDAELATKIPAIAPFTVGHGVTVASGGFLADAGVPFVTAIIEDTTPQTLADGQSTVTHTLGIVPRIIQPWLACQVANNGYAIGDKVAISFSAVEGGAVGRGALTATDLRSVDFSYILHGPLSIPNKAGTADVLITEIGVDSKYSDWLIYFEVFGLGVAGA